MKILFLSDDFPPTSFGGAGIMAFGFSKALKDKGNNVLVVTTTQNKKNEGVFVHENLRIYRIYASYHERWRAYLSLYNPQTVKKVQRIIEEFEPDVVHSHNIHLYLSYYCLKIAKKSGAKVFLTAHDAMSFHYGKLVEYVDPKNLTCPFQFNYKISPLLQIKRFKKRYNPFRNIIIRHYLKYVDKIIAVSKALKEAMQQNGIDNIEVIYNGIAIGGWGVAAGAVDEFKTRHNLIGKKVILFGGRLSEAKGGGKAILVMKELITKVPNLVMLIIGDKNEYSYKMLEIAKEANIENNLVFTGWISGHELKAAYHSSDVVIVPSIYLEPFGLGCIEAMACKKPVIATCFGGTRELVLDGETGYVVNPYNIKDMSDKLLKILGDSKLAEEMGDGGYKRVKTHFNLDDKVNEYIVTYKSHTARST